MHKALGHQRIGGHKGLKRAPGHSPPAPLQLVVRERSQPAQLWTATGASS